MHSVYLGEGSLRRYYLVIRLIKITDTAVVKGTGPNRILSRDRPRRSQDSSWRERTWTRSDGGGVSSEFIPRGCFMRLSRSSTAGDYSSKAAWTRVDREQTTSLATAASWINVIALLILVYAQSDREHNLLCVMSHRDLRICENNNSKVIYTI